jgi:hypothetical protein
MKVNRTRGGAKYVYNFVWLNHCVGDRSIYIDFLFILKVCLKVYISYNCKLFLLTV